MHVINKIINIMIFFFPAQVRKEKEEEKEAQEGWWRRMKSDAFMYIIGDKQ